MPGKFSPLYLLAKYIARIPVGLITRKHWDGDENLPPQGGFVAAANHLSEFDSMTYMHYLLNNGYPVRVLCKAELFKVPLLGYLMRSCKQIPVYRKETGGGDALRSALGALKAGECVGIYAEGTLTRDPDFWPMKAKTGAVRAALKTGVPVIPIVQWGAQDVLDRYATKPNLKGRKNVWVRALPALNLDDLRQRADDPEAWQEGTERLNRALYEGLKQLRSEIGLTGESGLTGANEAALGLPDYSQQLDPRVTLIADKKAFRRASAAWKADHPDILPSKRPLGEFEAYVTAAEAEIAAEETMAAETAAPLAGAPDTPSAGNK